MSNEMHANMTQLHEMLWNFSHFVLCEIEEKQARSIDFVLHTIILQQQSNAQTITMTLKTTLKHTNIHKYKQKT